MQDSGTSSRRGREWPLEYLRILAAVGIVWFHNSTAPLHWLGLSGLWVFLLISFTLLSRTAPNQPMAAFAAVKARRVMVPWVFWSVAYLLFGLWQFHRHGTPFYERWMLLTGFSLHLWYLPYLFGSAITLHFARRSNAAFDRPAGVLFFVLVGLVLLAANGVWHPDTPPFAQWMTAVPVTLLGYAWGRIALLPDTRSRRTAATALAVCVVAMCIARLFMPGRHGQDGMTVLLGFAAFVAIGALPLPSTAAVRLLSPLTLGIYLVHPLVMAVFAKMTGESGSLLRIIMVFAASAVVVYGMKKIPFLRDVV